MLASLNDPIAAIATAPGRGAVGIVRVSAKDVSPIISAPAGGASRSLAGAFSREIHTLRDALIHLRMLVEATLDFPDEEIDFLQKADAQGQLARLRESLANVLKHAKQGALLREGIKVVI